MTKQDQIRDELLGADEGLALVRDGLRTSQAAVARALKLMSEGEPPVVDPVLPDPPVDPTSTGFSALPPDPAFWQSPLTGKEGKLRMTVDWFYQGQTTFKDVAELPGLTGEYHGFQAVTPWDDSGTLWHANIYNVYGTIDGLKLNHIGDFRKGREGHGAYFRTPPHLDMTVQNCAFHELGGQALQREWRAAETQVPKAVWQGIKPSGTFIAQDNDFRETGLIDTDTGGMAVRASWAMSLYNTGQRTIVRRNRVHNVYSPGPHEGALFVGYGKDGYRTPYLEITDEDFYCLRGDRAIVFLQGCEEINIHGDVWLRGAQAYIDVVAPPQGAAWTCRLTVSKLPQDTVIRVKPAKSPHGSPDYTFTVPAGTSTVRVLAWAP